MRIVAHRGTRLHAPENTLTALVSAHTAGADVLELDLQLTADGVLVLSHDGDVERLTGTKGKISTMTLAELRKLDFSAKFRPRGAADDYAYRRRVRHRVKLETFSDVLDGLPEDVFLLVELKHDSSPNAERREAFVSAALAEISKRRIESRVVIYSKDPENLRRVASLAPSIQLAAFDWERSAAELIEIAGSVGASGVVIDIDSVLGADGQLTPAGRALAQAHAEGKLPMGALLYPFRTPGLFTPREHEVLRGHEFVWSLSTDSMLDVAFAVERWTFLANDFAGENIDTSRVALGYAKANSFAHVYQRDGVVLDIRPYDAEPRPEPGTALEQRVDTLEQQMWYAVYDWPFYSGGGFGVVKGIDGDFVAEVHYTTTVTSQATTLEMAVVNCDPGAHRAPWNADGTPRFPTSFRDKDSFYDPHGAPPFVGVEHDEDDGYRINWNLGHEYDNNQYGLPVGDGTAKGGRLRLERRGPWFSAYYRNDAAPDWVCVGTACNQSLNRRVFLRCAGKRWRQEDPADPTKYMPIVANRFTFRDLRIERFHRS